MRPKSLPGSRDLTTEPASPKIPTTVIRSGDGANGELSQKEESHTGRKKRKVNGARPFLIASLSAFLVCLIAGLLYGIAGMLFSLAITLLSVGAFLWWPPSASPSRRSDLGIALIGTAAIAFAVLGLQIALHSCFGVMRRSPGG
jgi:hypothetical protein